MADWESLPVEDRATIRDFGAFLEGTSACVICLTPTDACRAGGGGCCKACAHGRLVPCEGPAPRSGGRPRILVRDRTARAEGGQEGVR